MRIQPEGKLALMADKKINMAAYNYNVIKCTGQAAIDGKWDKPIWKYVESLSIANDNSWGPSYIPYTNVKLCYDDKNLYVIFRVQDRYVRCVTNKHNGPVWQDSCVELFFSPCPSSEPQYYFNLEVNCAGSVYMAYQRVPRIDFVLLSVEDITAIEIAHSIAGPVEKEIEGPVIWTVEYKLPFQLLKKYADILVPDKGVAWKANFFKCAENNSHPHWLSWTEINQPEPNFHLPEYFGTLRFS